MRSDREKLGGIGRGYVKTRKDLDEALGETSRSPSVSLRVSDWIICMTLGRNLS